MPHRFNGMFAFALWDIAASSASSSPVTASASSPLLLLARRHARLRLRDQGPTRSTPT